MGFIIFWLACGIPTYGITFAYFQGEYDTIAKEQEGSDRGFAFFYSLLGPIGLILSFLYSDFAKYGIRYFPRK